MPKSSRSTPRGFGKVDTWVFDLDNTLYPHHLLWQQVDDRIRSYVSEFLKVSKDEAFRVQKNYYKRYGTTMRGLMSEHGLNPDDYLEYVHQIDHSPLEPKPAAKTYERFLARHDVDAAKAAMFEDLARNLEAPHALGMTTVLVVPVGQREVFREDWELEGRDEPHVNYLTDDLAGFLERILHHQHTA